MNTLVPTYLNNRLTKLFDWDHDFVKAAQYPALNVVNNEKIYQVQAAVPGMRKEDLTVEILPGGYLRISGQSNQKESNKYQSQEIETFFERMVRLPNNLEDMPETELKDGVLTLTWNKIEPKKIEIRG